MAGYQTESPHSCKGIVNFYWEDYRKFVQWGKLKYWVLIFNVVYSQIIDTECNHYKKRLVYANSYSGYPIECVLVT